MEIVTIDRGQALQTFVADEVRPEREVYTPKLFALVQERYGFTGVSDVAKAKEAGAKFQNGVLNSELGPIAIDHLDIFRDGIVVMARTTEQADIVMNDAINWGMSTYGLRAPKTIRQRTHISWVIVDFSSSVSALIENFDKLQRLIADTDGRPFQFEIGRLSVVSDPSALPAYTNTEYLFDRRGGAPYGLNCFFCAAPLQTSAHIAFLKKFERLFGGT